MRGRQRGIWIATGAVLLAGLVFLVLVLLSPERRRFRAAERLEVGTSAQNATEQIGAPAARCAPGSLAHLTPSFPTGWPPPARQRAIELLEAETAERWVYPVSGDAEASCDPAVGLTEIGVDAEGNILWYIALTGRSRIELPSRIGPEVAEEVSAVVIPVTPASQTTMPDDGQRINA